MDVLHGENSSPKCLLKVTVVYTACMVGVSHLTGALVMSVSWKGYSGILKSIDWVLV